MPLLCTQGKPTTTVGIVMAEGWQLRVGGDRGRIFSARLYLHYAFLRWKRKKERKLISKKGFFFNGLLTSIRTDCNNCALHYLCFNVNIACMQTVVRQGSNNPLKDIFSLSGKVYFKRVLKLGYHLRGRVSPSRFSDRKNIKKYRYRVKY